MVWLVCLKAASMASSSRSYQSCRSPLVTEEESGLSQEPRRGSAMAMFIRRSVMVVTQADLPMGDKRGCRMEASRCGCGTSLAFNCMIALASERSYGIERIARQSAGWSRSSDAVGIGDTDDA